MATANKIIKTALRLIQVKAANEPVSASEGQDGLEALNDLIDSLTNEILMQTNRIELSIPFVAGQKMYTLGPGGDINFARPVAIENAFVRDGNTDWPIDEINNDQYERIVLKNTGGSYPIYFFYRAKYPLAEITFWPVPTGNTTLFLNVRNALPKYDDINQDISWPPGYERYLKNALALEIAPEYTSNTFPLVMEHANKSMEMIQDVNNVDIPVLNSPLYSDLDDTIGAWFGGCGCNTPTPPVEFDLIINTGDPLDTLYVSTGNPSDTLIIETGI